MRTTLYLYGVDPKVLKVLPYEEALQTKLKGAKEVLLTLLDVPLYDRDLKRIKEVTDAIEHTRVLLRELEEDVESPSGYSVTETTR